MAFVPAGENAHGSSRLFRVGRLEFDEGRRELRLGGQRLTLEAKPLDLLHQLLCRSGEVVTKEELITAAWGTADYTSEASLMTAISKLRSVLGESDRNIIESVRGFGYRIAGKVEIITEREEPRLSPILKQADAVPRRAGWRLERLLGSTRGSDVWSARNGSADEIRVFKFAYTAPSLSYLKREASISRVLHASLGERPDFVRIIGWNFEAAPFFIESEFGGADLHSWMTEQGASGPVDLKTRLGLMIQIARAIAAAHSAGVLHSDLKPSNILVSHDATGFTRIRLADFGAGGFTEAARTTSLTISLTDAPGGGPDQRLGSLRYLAPEVAQGASPTAGADVYALGVLLYQLVVGDLDRPLAAGWENDVDDSLLRQDIAQSAAGDIARRLPSAALLAERLETLDERRDEQARRDREKTETERLAKEVERARLRRPWIAATALALVAGLSFTTFAGLRALRERDESRRQTALAQAINKFLTEDLLGRGNPLQSGQANEKLMDAAAQAELGIDQRFASEPYTAGSIYFALARAFEGRSAFDAARAAYDHAITDFEKAQGPQSQDAIIVRLREASMEVVSARAGSLEHATALIASAEPQVAALGTRRAEGEVWLSSAKGLMEMMNQNVRASQSELRRAADLAETMPAVFDGDQRFIFLQREAFAQFRLGEWDDASNLLNELLAREMALHGPHHPDTLLTKFRLAEVLMGSGKSTEAVEAFDAIYPDFQNVYGPDHRLTLQLLGGRAQSLGILGRYDDAVRDVMTAYKLLGQKEGDRSFMTLTALADAAHYQCRAGQETDGLANAKRAFDGTVSAFGQKSVLTQTAAFQLAFCLVTAKRYVEAGSVLPMVDAKSVAEFEGDPDMETEMNLMEAEIARDKGDSGQQQVFLRLSASIAGRPVDPYLKHWQERLTQGQAHEVR